MSQLLTTTPWHNISMDLFLTTTIGLTLAFFISWLARVLLNPMNRIRSLRDDIGFAHVKGQGARKRDYVNRLRKLRKVGDIPMAFPNGWYAIAETREITPGEMIRVAALGQNLAVFRGLNSAQVHVTDTYCPHLGADLTAGGRVVGDCVECPFHRWTFDGESGQCVSGPASKKTRSLANLVKWHSVEVNGVVLVWYHRDGQPPFWNPLSVDEITNGEWVYQGRNEFIINCHIQDISENGADPAHLDAIHSSPIFFGGEPGHWTKFLNTWAWHEWQLQWRPLEPPQGHCSELELRHNLTLFGKWNLFDLKVKARQEGPSLVHLHFDSPTMGKGVMVQYVLPLEPTLQKVVHLFYTERSWWRAYAKLVLWGESVLVERDISVWNSKTYVRQPLAGVEDGPLLRHRRWFNQFYTSGSDALKNSGIEW